MVRYFRPEQLGEQHASSRRRQECVEPTERSGQQRVSQCVLRSLWGGFLPLPLCSVSFCRFPTEDDCFYSFTLKVHVSYVSSFMSLLVHVRPGLGEKLERGGQASGAAPVCLRKVGRPCWRLQRLPQSARAQSDRGRRGDGGVPGL